MTVFAGIKDFVNSNCDSIIFVLKILDKQCLCQTFKVQTHQYIVMDGLYELGFELSLCRSLTTLQC
jgi:hypothetical protein